MKYYIGWDVGAWQCQRSRSSCDAVVFLNEKGDYLGYCRERVSETIQAVLNYKDDDRAAFLVDTWLQLCGVRANFSEDDKFVMAIDTPLGWPKDFVALVTGKGISSRWKLPPRRSDIENTFLYRKTERDLGSSLSPITQQIGSQSTKGIALLNALGAKRESWGIWKVGSKLTLLETYPASCLRSAKFVNWVEGLETKKVLSDDSIHDDEFDNHDDQFGIHDDEFDAYICACVAMAFDKQQKMLVPPPADDPDQEIDEGWIFYPSGSLISPTLLHGKSDLVEAEKSFRDALAAVKNHVVASLNELDASTVEEWTAETLGELSENNEPQHPQEICSAGSSGLHPGGDGSCVVFWPDEEEDRAGHGGG